MLNIILEPTIIMSWVTEDHERILNEHSTAYQSATSEKAIKEVVKSIITKLTESGKKGLPTKLAKVGNAIPLLPVSHN